MTTIMDFVFVFTWRAASCRLVRRENRSKKTAMPSFTSRVVDTHPIISVITSLMFQKTPKKKSPRTASLTPEDRRTPWCRTLPQFADARVTPDRMSKTPRACVVVSRCPREMKAKSIVNTAHRVMVAATTEMLPIPRPLKKR